MGTGVSIFPGNFIVFSQQPQGISFARQSWAPNVGQAAVIHEDLDVIKGGESGRGYSFLLGRAKGKSHWKPGKSPEY